MLSAAPRPGPGDTQGHARLPDEGAPVLRPVEPLGRVVPARAEGPESAEALDGDCLDLIGGCQQCIGVEYQLLTARGPLAIVDEQFHTLSEVQPGDRRLLGREET